MDSLDKDCLRQLDNHLAASHQSWFFGAGISVDANIPLMAPLTERIFALASQGGDKDTQKAITQLRKELPDDSHIEHILSHLGDLATLAERSKGKAAKIGSLNLELTEIRRIHAQILDWISETIRWGYSPSRSGSAEVIGNINNPIIDVSGHSKFFSAIFNRAQAGIAERRGALKLFTINYDTLLEDALALNCYSYWDGFSGGAVAYRNHVYGKTEPEHGYRAHVIKLHGSIDWRLDTNQRILRVRDNDSYPKDAKRVLIYPQSTKYYATQHDPFAAQFELLRKALNSSSENVFAICGYSFGDEHINQEIEMAMNNPYNKTTILAFAKNLSNVLEKWRSQVWAKRLFVIAEDGLYVGANGPFFTSPTTRDWWSFAGATKLLNNGAEACAL